MGRWDLHGVHPGVGHLPLGHPRPYGRPAGRAAQVSYGRSQSLHLPPSSAPAPAPASREEKNRRGKFWIAHFPTLHLHLLTSISSLDLTILMVLMSGLMSTRVLPARAELSFLLYIVLYIVI